MAVVDFVVVMALQTLQTLLQILVRAAVVAVMES
jgi:hypothetical protein